MRAARVSDRRTPAGPARTGPQYVQHPRALSRSTRTSVVLLPPGAAEPVVLSATAVDIWESYAVPATVEGATARLRDRFDPAAQGSIADDVRHLTDALVANGALVIAP